MQRTTALREAQLHDGVTVSERQMRVEFWITEDANSLLYRMLVLNTGQVPWNLQRQIELIFRSILKEIKQRVPQIEVFTVDDVRRRALGGQFQASEVAELFMVFGARKETIDTKEKLADEFTKLDFIEATSDREFNTMFYGVLGLLSEIDAAFSRYQGEPTTEVHEDDDAGKIRFRKGRDLFASQPARVAFMAAMSQFIYGRPGINKNEKEHATAHAALLANGKQFIVRLNVKTPTEIGQFLDFGTLNQLISRRVGKVGEFERSFFFKAFATLLEERFEVESMVPSWRAY